MFYRFARGALAFMVLVAVMGMMGLAGAMADDKPEKVAEQSAIAWLALVDEGKYAESHAQASGFFKNAVTADQLKQSFAGVRDPLGRLVSRKVQEANYSKTLPGAPDGEYVVVQFATTFEHKASAVETVSLVREGDGKWRPMGYFIK